MHNPTQRGEGRQLPVFVFPSSVTFYFNEPSTHKQILTLYNPYEFPLKFKVLCTNPRKYTVVDSEGKIRPRCCVDIVIRHVDVCASNVEVKFNDKLRIQVSEVGQKKVLGQKDVPMVLLSTRESKEPDESFHSLPPTAEQDAQQPMSIRQNRPGNTGPSMILVCVAIFCIIALMLPADGDVGSRLPSYLFLSVPQKLIAAYILGLITMVILRA